MTNEAGFNLFSQQKKEKDPKGAQETPQQDYSQDFIQISRRLQVMEEGLSNLRKKILVNEQNDLSRHKKILLEEKTTLEEIKDVKKEIDAIKITIKEVISELKNSARKSDVDVFKRYIDMWNPVNFVTENTVEKMIDEKLGKTNEVE
ncbi:hypothetical protein CEE44_03480 [Candidatus Woesearchaeota archaeon B3_Woes]|nr:MAG: hypothetical protein CEE44_03480 [Candidatus Woesearchaeota archaeon B3_Woes]